MKNVVVVYGTRPEAIKLAPVVLALRKIPNIRLVVVSTGQHTGLLAQTESALHLTPDVQLGGGQLGQTLNQSFSLTLGSLGTFYQSGALPDMVVVQGDTTTATAASLAAFYLKIPVAHVEAGLRTHNKLSPFPEEVNRVLIDQISTLLFAPTSISAVNLGEEGITKNVYVVGNTIVDAFNLMNLSNSSFKGWGLPYLVLTMHRRENFGAPMRAICHSMLKILSCHNVELVIPIHPNPEVQKIIVQELGNHQRIRIVPPMDYVEFLQLAQGSKFLLSDSGGVQEEAVLLHKPILVLRENTERPEVISCGIGELVGIQEDGVFSATHKLLLDNSKYQSMCKAVNPFGDGQSSERIATLISSYLSSS